MTKTQMLLLAVAILFKVQFVAAQSVHVEPPQIDEPRPLAEQTQQGVVRDYLESWKTMEAALEQNRTDLLGKDFIGIAKDKLTDTVHQQLAAHINTRYIDHSHNLQIVFYSPEGLSVQLTDDVDYEVQVFDNNKQISSQQVHCRYIAVLTPAEVRWRVRVFQAQNK